MKKAKRRTYRENWKVKRIWKKEEGKEKHEKNHRDGERKYR